MGARSRTVGLGHLAVVSLLAVRVVSRMTGLARIASVATLGLIWVLALCAAPVASERSRARSESQ
jgi:hypothetical protein